MMRTTRLLAPVLAAGLGLSAAACGGGDDDRTARATSAAEGETQVDAVTLRIGTNDPADAPDVPQMLDEFAQRVAELSAGSMVVEPVWRAAGDPAPDDWDQAVAHKIVDGELDMGLIPAGAWDVMGVTTLRALNAPFLVDSDTLVGDVASGDLASDLLVGLDEVGVTGLALIPEGLRHVFSFGDPLLAPDDFAGTSIRSPRSDTVYALFEALGAAANDVQGSEFDTAVQDGSLAGAESSYSRAGGLPGSQQSVVGNLPLFPKVEALVVNSARFDALTEEQRAVLQGAAERTREAVVAATVDDATQAKAYCEETGSVALASDEQLAAFDEAAEPIYAQLEQDSATASLIARIRELKEKTAPAPPVTACEHEPGATEASSYAGPVIPNGRYTKVTTRAEALERGLDPSIVDEMLGPDGEITVMFEIEDGRWTQYEIADTGTAQEGDLGTYSYDSDGQWVTVSESGGCRGCVGVFDWTLEDGVLRLAIVPADDAAITDDVRLITEGEFRHGS